MNFDLNIENYGLNELIEMFDLPKKYDKEIVENRESSMKNNILDNNELDLETKDKTLNFILKAKNILMKNITENKNYNSQSDNDKKFKETLLELYNSSYDLKKVDVDEESGHMLQDKKALPYLSSYPSEFFPGIINPLKRKTNRIFVNIDTRFRDNYYGSQSTNFFMGVPALGNVLSMQLSQIELPTTFYAISKQLGNNYFNISANLIGQSPFNTLVEIPSGNYSYENMITLLNTIMSNLGGLFANILFGINITDVNTGSGQMYVSINSNYTGPPFEFALNFQANMSGTDDRNTPLPLKLGWMFGFRNGYYFNNTNYVSEGLVNLLGPRYLYLSIDDYNRNLNNGFYSAFSSSVLNKNILARISLQSNAFNIFSENNLNLITYPRKYFGPVNIGHMTIQLLDEYGRIVNLNNMDYSFCLTFEVAYDI